MRIHLAINFYTQNKMFPLPHTANHSCLGVEVVSRRRLSPFLAHTYVPDVVIVSSSFLTFYVDCGHSALAARDGSPLNRNPPHASTIIYTTDRI